MMENKKLHPSVEKFKDFVKRHPAIAASVRNEEYTWQELFEDWYLLGEEDPKWKQFQESDVPPNTTSTNDEKGWVNQITGLLKNMDVNQMQNHINSLSQAIGAVQGILTQFQGQNASNVHNTPQQSSERKHPFAFRKD